MLYPKEIGPQKLETRKDSLPTLNGFHKLLGDIQWLQPYLKLSMGNLEPSVRFLRVVVILVPIDILQMLADKYWLR